MYAEQGAVRIDYIHPPPAQQSTAKLFFLILSASRLLAIRPVQPVIPPAGHCGPAGQVDRKAEALFSPVQEL